MPAELMSLLDNSGYENLLALPLEVLITLILALNL